MGEAREVMDHLTQAFFNQDYDTAAKLYASDAVIVTPDAGELKGGGEVTEYMKVFFEAFPDARYEPINALESGNTAVDEGRFIGTNTGSLRLPTGEELPATGKGVDVRGCDIATVENGLITSHRFYFDQMEMLTQLGLAPQ
ncbi:MAG: ester cyclase [Actinomycetota bacterium]|nr:ester cyclase [Actinomycetota bacterium]